MTVSTPRAVTPSLAPKKYDVANLTFSDLGKTTARPLVMLKDRKTVIGPDATTQFLLYFSTNLDSSTPTWNSMRHSFSGRFIGMVLELANGELLIANNGLSGPSSMYVSSGFPAAQAAGYTNASLDAIVWTLCLTMVSGGPTGAYSQHYSSIGTDGTVVISESGSQTTTARAADPFTQGATRVWISRDNAKTFTQIFDIYDYGVTQGMPTNVSTNLHIHGVSYDQLWNRVIVCYGDDTGQARAVAGAGNAEAVFIDFDVTNTQTAVTKVPLGADYINMSSGQFIVCTPTPHAYIYTCDVSSPQVIGIVPRNGYRAFGAWRNGPTQQGNGVNCRVTGLPYAGAPIFFPCNGSASSPANASPLNWVVAVTDNGGKTFTEITGDVPAQTPAITNTGIPQVLGPFLSGKIIMPNTGMYVNNDNTKTSMIADLVYPGA